MTVVFQLDNDIWFPPPELAEESGLLAVGGDLSIPRLLLAYSHGIFPWFSFRDSEEPRWYCPHERFVIFPDEIHVSHSMRTLLRKDIFKVTFNQDFCGVIENCSKLRIDEEGAWLGPDIIKAFTQLHDLGIASSVEVWQDGSLVGGLYGVNVGRVFIGESMFSLVPSASKVALISLARCMSEKGGTMIDCQLETPHLLSMGGRYISYDEYMRIMEGRDENEEE